MATVQFSPIGNAAQFFNTVGQPLNAGTLNTYAAGTSTPLATYTDATGGVSNANPITLGFDGRVPQEIWLAAGTGYKFVLSDSLGNIIAAWDNIVGIPASIVLRDYIAGLTMSTAGGSSSMTVAAGQATDTTGTVTMNLAAAITKTTALWAVGNNQGGLDAGSIANNTWYHFFLIYRSDTGASDVVFSTSPSSPGLPTNYTNLRRIGSGRTDGSAHWTAFTQDSDTFWWSSPVTLDINAGNPGTAAVTRALTVPTGVNVIALLAITIANTDATRCSAYFSDLANADVAPISGGFAQVGSAQAGNIATSGGVQVRTNTSAQIRTRIDFSSINVVLQAGTLGWVDRRGRDA